MTNFLSELASKAESFISVAESDVLTVIVAARKGEMVFAEDLDKGIKFFAANAPTIISDINTVLSVAADLGVTGDPRVAIAISAAQATIAGLNAVAAAHNSGATDIAVVINGYLAIQRARAASASALAAAVSAPPAKS